MKARLFTVDFNTGVLQVRYKYQLQIYGMSIFQKK